MWEVRTMRFKGIYTPIITPFHEDFSIDWDAYAEVIEFQIEAGVAGIIVGGSTGEVYALSKQERLEQIAFARDRIAGRTLLMAGVNDMRTSECLAIATAARDAGVDALLVAAPPYSLPDESELAEHVLAIDRAASLPIMLYNYPGRTGVMMGEAFLAGVEACANVCAIKESSGDVNRYHLIYRRFPHLQLVVGADDQVLETFAWGSQAWVSATANIFPLECRRFLEICALGGDFESGRRIMAAMLPLMQLLEQGGKFIQCVKHGALLQGLRPGVPRPPMQPMPEELARQMDDLVDATRTAVNAIIAEPAVPRMGGVERSRAGAA
jgi:4-hydroxy-tetrahydrodipicolinate synthase